MDKHTQEGVRQRGEELDARKQLTAALARIERLEKVVSRCNGEFKAISMMHRIDVDEAIAATSAALEPQK